MKDNLRILYISYNGLLEEIVPSQVTPYLKELAKKGYSFTLLTFEKKDRLKRAGRKVLAELKNELKDEGIEWHWLRYHKKMPLLATSFDVFLGAIVALYYTLTRKVQIIHTRSVVPAAMSLLSKVLGIKLIFDTRGLLAEEYVGGGHWKEGDLKYRIVKFFERVCLNAADTIIVLTERHRRYLLKSPFYKNRDDAIEIVPCCVDLTRFRYDFCDKSTKKEDIKSNFVFLYPGKIGKHYMLNEMLDFFIMALERLPDARFIVVTPNEEKEVLRIVSRKGVDPHKISIKRPTFKEIPSLISLAHAGIFFINPYKKFGSSPIKLGEFLSCGIPIVINSGIGDTEELVRSNNVGVVVERFDDNDYKNALGRLLELMKEGESLNKRCRKTAEAYLSLDLGVKKYSAIYNRVCKCIA